MSKAKKHKVNLWWKVEDTLAELGILKRAKTLWKKKLNKKEYKKALKMIEKEMEERAKDNIYDKTCQPMKYTHFGYGWLEYARYGWRRVWHPAVDYNHGSPYSDLGDPLFAVADGIVTYRAYGRGWGWHLFIIHSINHKKYGKVRFWSHYAHLQERPSIKEGERVKCGQKIAKCGKSGGWRYPHLHAELRKNPLGVNFFPYGKSRSWVKARYYNPLEFLENNN